jgi:hypothetical protein
LVPGNGGGSGWGIGLLAESGILVVFREVKAEMQPYLLKCDTVFLLEIFRTTAPAVSFLASEAE